MNETITTILVIVSIVVLYAVLIKNEKDMEERPINPPSFYEKDVETEICFLCEYDFPKNNMNQLGEDFICNKCLRELKEDEINIKIRNHG